MGVINQGLGFTSNNQVQWVNDGIDRLSSLPRLVLRGIFSQFDFSDLATATLLCRRLYNAIEKEENGIVWKIAIYEKLAFKVDTWAKYFGEEVVAKERRDHELQELPPDIVYEYRKFYRIYGINKDGLNLVRVPKTLNGGLTLNSFGVLLKKRFPDNSYGYRLIWDRIVTELGDKSIPESCWMFGPTDVMPNSIKSRYANQPRSIENFYALQQEILANLTQNGLIGYKIPKTLELVACGTAKYCDTANSETLPRNHTPCEENIDGNQVIVGGYGGAGVLVHYETYGYGNIGVGVIKKL